MKLLRLAAVFTVLLLLCSCTSHDADDINEFLKRLNASPPLCAEDFRITARDGLYRYSHMENENTLICIYAAEDGAVTRCTVTELKNQPEFEKHCVRLTEAFTRLGSEESSMLVKRALDCGNARVEEFKLTLIDSDVGRTFLVCLLDDEINTNEHPTLKGPIDEDDISRPTDIVTQSKNNH